MVGLSRNWLKRQTPIVARPDRKNSGMSHLAGPGANKPEILLTVLRGGLKNAKISVNNWKNDVGGQRGLKLPCPTLENKLWGKSTKNCISFQKNLDVFTPKNKKKLRVVPIDPKYDK